MIKHKRHPLQPLYKDCRGVARFRPNEIVKFLLVAGKVDMNMLAVMPFEQEDRKHFAQLIGYSLGGFAELSYVTDQDYEEAVAASDIDE